VANTDEEAMAEYYPGYAELCTKLGRERGWPTVTKTGFDTLLAPKDVLVVGGPVKVAAKLVKHSAASGSINRFTFQMENAGLSHGQLLSSIDLFGSKVIPLVNKNQ